MIPILENKILIDLLLFGVLMTTARLVITSRIKKIPVIAHTSSGTDRDIQKSYSPGVDGDIVKSLQLDNFIAVVPYLGLNYFTRSRLPVMTFSSL